MVRTYKAVFFDAGGTLFRPFPSVGEIYARTAAPFGAKCDPVILEAEFQNAWKRRGGLSSLGSRTNEEKERRWWHTLVEEVFVSSGGVPDFDTFFSILHASFTSPGLWKIFPEVKGVLKKLRKCGCVLGIVSNWDLRLPVVIKNLGLSEYFHFTLGSSACGATKPSPKIFREALKQAAAAARQAVHVGDTYEEDFLGAEAIGIESFHLARNGDASPAPKEKVIKSLAELLDRLT